MLLFKRAITHSMYPCIPLHCHNYTGTEVQSSENLSHDTQGKKGTNIRWRWAAGWGDFTSSNSRIWTVAVTFPVMLRTVPQMIPQMPWGRGLLHHCELECSYTQMVWLCPNSHTLNMKKMTLCQIYLPLSFALFWNTLFLDVAVACSNVKQPYNPMSTAKLLLRLLPS